MWEAEILFPNPASCSYQRQANLSNTQVQNHEKPLVSGQAYFIEINPSTELDIAVCCMASLYSRQSKKGQAQREEGKY